MTTEVKRRRKVKVRSHCFRGHEYTKENTIVLFDKKLGAPRRQCRACKNAARRYWNLDKKVERILGLESGAEKT